MLMFFKGVAQGCVRYYLSLFKAYFNAMIVAIESANQGVAVGGDRVSGLMLADDFAGISETPEGLSIESRGH